MAEPVLVADIGGTNARFALAEMENGAVLLRETKRFRAKDFDTIRDAAGAYLHSIGAAPASACFAVAGPVTDDNIEFTNSRWVLNIAEMKKGLALKRLRVVNDFEALATGVPVLRQEDFFSVKPGRGDPQAPVLVIGPGTGLGQALIVPFGAQRRVVSTEGGHVSFAPQSDEEIAVMKFILNEHDRVSVERILSGPGIVTLHRALCAISGARFAPVEADEIARAAIEGDAAAQKTLGLFCALLGRAAGDAALATGARDGVVLGGGVLPKIREFFMKSAFVDCFHDKGRMRDYLKDIPVRMIVTDGAALAGAAIMAVD
ncbi:glucokinase [Hyphococcus sp.]|uniref:glucokinase n=1 Tax=Hyphococcus sp. TaxID=2038636 RepID=UPI003D124EA1